MLDGNLIGEWKSDSQTISLFHSASNHFLAQVQDKTGNQTKIDSDHIKCGVLGATPHSNLIQKINQLAQEKIKEHFAVCCYPFQGQPTEVWVFEATKGATLWIKKAKENLKQRDPEKEEKTIRCYKESIKNFEEAFRFQKSQKGDTAELSAVILQLQKELLLLHIKRDLPLYLSSTQERETLIKIIEIYSEEEDIFSSLSEYLNLHKESNVSPCQLFLSALRDEHFDRPSLAIQNYLHLAEHHSDPLPCFKKAEELVKQTIVSDPFALSHFLEKLDRNRLIQLRQITHYPEDLERLILQKDAVRMTFEKCLTTLNQHSPQTKAPTCFICFNEEETDVAKWLEQVLVPDLDRMGIQPLFCFRDLNPAKAELKNFQGLIRGADQVMMVCTPDLKRKCEKRKKNPMGIAQEIRLAKERYNDADKYETIFLLYLKGDRKESCPSEFFEPIQGVKLNKNQESSVFSYYENAFEFFGGMRNIPRNISRQIKDDFLLKANKIFAGEINREDLEKWRQTRQSQIESVLKAAQERVTKMTQMVHLPFPPKDFTGRQQELKDLHTACQNYHRVAITGLGGVGKTALAIKYANDHQADYQFIYHIPAGTSQQIRDGLLQLADDLHLPKAQKIEERLELLKRRLDQFEQKYLLIFDGIDQVEAFKEFTKYLPERGNCLLLTSRMPEQSRIRDFEIIELKPFSLEDAVSYLLRASGSKEKEKADELAERLGRLPLALKHAAGYIRSRKISIHEYIQQFDQFQLKLFEDVRLNLLSEEEKTILTTWNISLNAIETVHNCPLAKEVMAFFAFLGQAPISLDLVKDWFKTSHPTTLWSLLKDWFKTIHLTREELDLGDALGHLCGYSMIDSPSPDFYQVHPLVQKVTCHQMANPQQVFELTFMALDLQLRQFQKDEVNTWSPTKPAIPHAVSLFEKRELMRNIVLKKQYEFMNQLGRICHTHGNFPQALEVWQDSLEVAEQWHKNHLHLEEGCDVLGVSYNNIGESLKTLGKYEEALNYHQKALEISLKVYGEEHPIVAIIYNDIGLSLDGLGKYEEALNYKQKALKIFLKVHGEEHPNVATSYENIGLSLNSLGKYNEAFGYLQKALKINLKIYGKGHPGVESSYHNIGVNLQNLGKYEEALNYNQKALKIYLKLYGEEHPNVATSYENIGLSLNSLGKYDEALEYLQKALKIKLKVYEEEHPSVATSYNNIGNNLQSLGKYKKALNYRQKALKILLKVHGDEHPDVAISYHNIASSFQAFGDSEEALKYLQKALKIKLKVYGDGHPDVAMSYNNIGKSLKSLGKYNAAFEYFQKALSIMLKVHGEEHPDTVMGYNSIGDSLKSLGEYDEALESLQKALRIALKVYEKEHPIVAKTYNNIGECLRVLGKYDKALESLQKALEIWRKVYGEEHPDIATIYNNLGLNLWSSGKCNEALDYLQKALKIWLKGYGEDHPFVAGSYNNIGSCLLSLGKYDEALKCHQKAVKIYEKIYPSNHPELITTRLTISMLLNKPGESSQRVKNQSRLKTILDHYGVSSKEQALRRAAWEGSTEDMKYLIEEEKVDINSQDQKKKFTALHWAVKRKNKIAILLLLQIGANPNITDARGKKPKDYDQDGLMKEHQF